MADILYVASPTIQRHSSRIADVFKTNEKFRGSGSDFRSAAWPRDRSCNDCIQLTSLRAPDEISVPHSWKKVQPAIQWIAGNRRSATGIAWLRNGQHVASNASLCQRMGITWNLARGECAEWNVHQTRSPAAYLSAAELIRLPPCSIIASNVT